MEEGEANKSEEDKLLDPIARSILRDLEAGADDEHVTQEHMSPETITITLDNGEVIRCDVTELTWNELVHCNMALEQDGNDADGLQGGQYYGIVLDTPLTVIIEGGILVVILEDGTRIRCDDEDLTENEIIHCNVALERNPLLGRHADGSPITGRYDEEGNPDPDGQRDADGDLLRGRNPDGTPIHGDADGPGSPSGDDARESSGGDGDAADGNPGEDDDAADGNLGGDSDASDGSPSGDGTTESSGGDGNAAGSVPGGGGDVVQGGRYDADCNPDPEGEYDADCNYVGGRYNLDGDRDPNGLYDADGNYIGGRYDADCNPDPDGQYGVNCNYVGGRYDENGNPDPNGQYDENGVLIYGSLSPSSSPVTPSPTVSARPTVSPRPTIGPSYHPTLHGDPWVLRGTIYYDRNANGERDSNVDTAEFGDDVEFNYGLGGVTVQLMECDPETNEELASSEFYGTGENSYASTVSLGYDVLMHANLAGQEEDGGKYNLVDIKVDRAYYIYVTAPGGYLLSGGVCNDNVPGWECTYKTMGVSRMLRGNGADVDSAVALRRSLDGAKARPPPGAYTPPSEAELELGIYEGRSEKCVRVDRFGMPESHLDLGVMRIGDLAFEDTDVELSLDLIEPEIDGLQRGRRSLLDVIRERILQQDSVEGQDNDGSFVLLQKDKEAIGIVAAEVLASTLDESLPKKDAILDSVSAIDVVYVAPEPVDLEQSSVATVPTRREMDAARDDLAPKSRSETGGKLSVSVLIKGHYNRKDVGIDFDYIVQDSIYLDSERIREGLASFNENCRNQISKVVDLGYTVDDFLEIHSGKGVDLPKSRLNQRQQEKIEREVDPQAFSSACNQKMELPAYFEASLSGLKLKAKTEARVQVVQGGGSSAWRALGFALLGLLGVTVIALCMVCFLYFRREKKRQQTQKEVGVTLVRPIEQIGIDKSMETSNKSMDENVRINGGKTSKSPTMAATPVPRGERKHIVGRLQRELSNMRLAVENERKRRRRAQRSDTRETARQDSLQSGQSVQSGVTGLGARIHNNATDGDEVKDGNAPATETANAPEKTPRTNSAKEVMEDDEAVEGPNALSEVVAHIHSGRRNRVSTSLKVGNPAPKRINTDFRDDSGSSSDEDDSSESSSDSSSDSNSSSSEEESEAPSQLMARKQKGRRGSSAKNRREEKKREETKPTRSRKAMKKVRMKKRLDVGKTGHSLHDRGGLAKPGSDLTAGHRRRTAGDQEMKEIRAKPCRNSTASHRRRTTGDRETKGTRLLKSHCVSNLV